MNCPFHKDQPLVRYSVGYQDKPCFVCDRPLAARKCMYCKVCKFCYCLRCDAHVEANNLVDKFAPRTDSSVTLFNALVQAPVVDNTNKPCIRIPTTVSSHNPLGTRNPLLLSVATDFKMDPRPRSPRKICLAESKHSTVSDSTAFHDDDEEQKERESTERRIGMMTIYRPETFETELERSGDTWISFVFGKLCMGELPLESIQAFHQRYQENINYDASRCLILALRRQRLDVATWLIDVAHPLDYSSESSFAVILAAENGYVDILRHILRDPRTDPAAKNDRPLELACKNGHVRVVQLLLKNPRVTPSTRWNVPLQRAAYGGHTDVVRVLLKDARVDPKEMCDYASRWAAMNGHDETLAVLLKDGRANPFESDMKTLLFALSFNHKQVVRLMLFDDRLDLFWNQGELLVQLEEKGYADLVAEVLYSRYPGTLFTAQKQLAKTGDPKYEELGWEINSLNLEGHCIAGHVLQAQLCDNYLRDVLEMAMWTSPLWWNESDKPGNTEEGVKCCESSGGVPETNV